MVGGLRTRRGGLLAFGCGVRADREDLQRCHRGSDRAPVSYTHLDVYKRQMYRGTASRSARSAHHLTQCVVFVCLVLLVRPPVIGQFAELDLAYEYARAGVVALLVGGYLFRSLTRPRLDIPYLLGVLVVACFAVSATIAGNPVQDAGEALSIVGVLTLCALYWGCLLYTSRCV